MGVSIDCYVKVISWVSSFFSFRLNHFPSVRERYISFLFQETITLQNMTHSTGNNNIAFIECSSAKHIKSFFVRQTFSSLPIEDSPKTTLDQVLFLRRCHIRIKTNLRNNRASFYAGYFCTRT